MSALKWWAKYMAQKKSKILFANKWNSDYITWTASDLALALTAQHESRCIYILLKNFTHELNIQNTSNEILRIDFFTKINETRLIILGLFSNLAKLEKEKKRNEYLLSLWTQPVEHWSLHSASEISTLSMRQNIKHMTITATTPIFFHMLFFFSYNLCQPIHPYLVSIYRFNTV